jgi:succinate-acetate transporter protein
VFYFDCVHTYSFHEKQSHPLFKKRYRFRRTTTQKQHPSCMKSVCMVPLICFTKYIYSEEIMSNNTIANPAPLGLLGFGMTTLLLNIHNAGIIPLSIVIVAMGFALGGAAQIIAGVMEFKKNNVFGATAFTAYGFFWWSLILIWMNPFAAIQAADDVSMGFYLLVWGIFTLLMFVGTLKHNRALQLVFASLTLLFFLLAIADFTSSTAIKLIAGWVGIFCGATAMYASLAQVINNEFDKTVLPL